MKIRITIECDCEPWKYKLNVTREKVFLYGKNLFDPAAYEAGTVNSNTGRSFESEKSPNRTSRTYTSSAAILNSEKAYHVYLIAYDGISVKVESIFIPKTFVLIDFNASGKGIGIGKISEHENKLAIGMDIQWCMVCMDGTTCNNRKGITRYMDI